MTDTEKLSELTGFLRPLIANLDAGRMSTQQAAIRIAHELAKLGLIPTPQRQARRFDSAHQDPERLSAG